VRKYIYPLSFLLLLMITPLPGDDFVWRDVPNNTFTVGERIKYEICWQFIIAGYATLEIPDIVTVNERPCYHIVATAWSTAFLDTFFKVRDVNESFMDKGSLCSLLFCSKISEGNFRASEKVYLDHPGRRFRIPQIAGPDKTGPIAAWSQDVLSALYFLRTQNLGVGQTYYFSTQSQDKNWPLEINVVRREKVRVPAGEFDCFMVEPKLIPEAGIFKAKGKLYVWFTADERRLPVLMRSKIVIGSIDARMSSVNR
jgi:hypothetical protein